MGQFSEVSNLQVAEIIKEDLWPNPLKYFNNVSVVATLTFILKNPFVQSLPYIISGG